MFLFADCGDDLFIPPFDDSFFRRCNGLDVDLGSLDVRPTFLVAQGRSSVSGNSPSVVLDAVTSLCGDLPPIEAFVTLFKAPKGVNHPSNGLNRFERRH